MRLIVIALALIMFVGCSGSSGPMSPSATGNLTLSGTVTGAGTPVSGATVLILDGANANRSTTSNAAGQFQITGLQSGGFTISVSAVDYATSTQPISLTGNAVVSVALVKLPRAVLENVPETLQGMLQPDGTYSVAPTGLNSGTGCAGSVAGTTTFNNTAGTVKSILWSLPPSTVIRPGDRFTYTVCCLTHDQAFSAGVSYFTAFTYTTVPCS